MGNKIKLFIKILIFVFAILLWTIIDFETSPLYYLSTFLDKYHSFELRKQELDTWAVRGQIGDILAGYFSALAFVGIAYSIYLQSEGNKQIKDSLTIQSTALEAQIKELQESREESGKQTEEFFISNMNVKLDRYYRILDKNLETVTKDDLIVHLGRRDERRKLKKRPEVFQDRIDNYDRMINNEMTKIRPIVMTLNFMYNEIKNIKKFSPLVYQTYIEELRLRLHSNEIFSILNTQIEEFKNIPVFDLYKKEK